MFSGLHVDGPAVAVTAYLRAKTEPQSLLEMPKSQRLLPRPQGQAIATDRPKYDVQRGPASAARRGSTGELRIYDSQKSGRTAMMPICFGYDLEEASDVGPAVFDPAPDCPAVFGDASHHSTAAVKVD